MTETKAFLSGGGQMGAAIRGHDWSQSTLGGPETWPLSLKTLVNVMLGSNQPMFIAWGPERTMLYNDPYAQVLGNKHPALGKDFLKVWDEIRGNLEPLVAMAYNGEPSHMDDIELVMNRKGYAEVTHWAYSYTPIHDETGGVNGFFCPCNEITQQVLAESRLRDAEIKFRALVTASSDVIYRMSPDWTEMRQLDGRGFLADTEQASVRWIDAYIFPEDRPRVFAVIEEAVRTKGVFELEHRVRRADGDVGWTVSRAVPVVGEDGEIVEWFGMASDVTGRKLSQAGILDAEERLRLATENAEIGFWDVDPVNDVLFWPPRVKAMFGISADVPVSMADFYAGLHPADRDRTAQAYAAAVDPARRGLYDVEYRTVGAEDGVVRWVAAKGRGLFDETGVCIRVVGTAIDISARKAVEEQLRESEELNRRVLQSSADCIKVLSLNGELEFMSEGGMGVMEVDDFNAIQGACWSDFWLGEENGKALAAIEEAKRGGVGRFQGFATMMKGAPRWWDVLVTAIDGADGAPEKLLSVSRDVTANRQIEEELRELNETLERQVADRTVELRRFRHIVEATTSPICAFDREYRLIAFNKAHNDEFRRVNGFDTKLGDVFPDLFIPAQGQIMRTLMSRALSGESFTVTQAFGRPELGQPIWEISYTPLCDENGTVIGAFHLAVDISDRLRTEADLATVQDALRQSQKMEAMGSLTGGVAHDFNNLLTPILGALDMLQRKGIGGEREQRLIAGAIQSADRAKTLVQRLLAFARRQPLQPTAVDLALLVQGMADLVASTTGPQIKVVVDAAEGLAPARADPNQLEMAILNLAVNARDAMPEGGALRISVESESIGAAHRSGVPPGDYLKLSVADTGEGMDEDTLKRAIEPFFSTKGVGKGTGLGLSMVHGLASQLGGALTITSTRDLGTTVELWLPQSAESSAVTSEPAVGFERTVNAGGVALLVDDEDAVRLSTADMLSELGYAVVEATSAEEALKLIAQGVKPDVLITDHLMPGMSGSDLARAVMSRQPSAKVLIVSGYAEAEGIGTDLPTLTKPFRSTDLAARLMSLG